MCYARIHFSTENTSSLRCIHLSVPHVIFMHIAREFSCWYILWTRKQHNEWITSFSSFMCVCFVIPCEMHIYSNISFHSTLCTAKLIQISVFVTLHHIEIYCVFLFLFSFSRRSVRLLFPLCCSPIAWIVIWRTYNAFILIHCHHRHHHHHPAMDEIFNSNGITLSLPWFWLISFGGYHKWSNFPAIFIKMFSFNIRTILWFYTV